MAKQTVDNRKLQDAIGVKIKRIQNGFYESYEREARNILMAIAQEGVKKIKEYIKKYFYDETSESPYYERLAPVSMLPHVGVGGEMPKPM